ncbi:hypothetical protein TWF694_008833 [Orbilia ellipsospora]|uniref:Uncharacterized protein n=1 Tax=Orbilia ellipsospora TaxID=2528407 RepID=A0AAV9XE33_9PEZI
MQVWFVKFTPGQAGEQTPCEQSKPWLGLDTTTLISIFNPQQLVVIIDIHNQIPWMRSETATTAKISISTPSQFTSVRGARRPSVFHAKRTDRLQCLRKLLAAPPPLSRLFIFIFFPSKFIVLEYTVIRYMNSGIFRKKHVTLS